MRFKNKLILFFLGFTLIVAQASAITPLQQQAIKKVIGQVHSFQKVANSCIGAANKRSKTLFLEAITTCMTRYKNSITNIR